MKYRARRDCNPGMKYYYQGRVYGFRSEPDPELFERVDDDEPATRREPEAHPGGRSVGAEEASAMKRAARPGKAARKD